MPPGSGTSRLGAGHDEKSASAEREAQDKRPAKSILAASRRSWRDDCSSLLLESADVA